MSQYELFARQGAGSFAVQVALEEAAADYRMIWISTEADEVARFRAINPTGKIPALRLPDGTLMFESAAMLIHLAAAHPAADLAPPAGTALHALFLQWMTFLSANVYEAALRSYYPDRYSTRGAQDAQWIRERGHQDFLAHLAFVGRVMNPYVLGERYSIVDAYLHMLSKWYADDAAELQARVPAFAIHARAVSGRPAFIKAEAAHTA